MSVIALGGRIRVAYLDLLAHKEHGEGETPPHFLGLIALATDPADAYEDSRAYLS